MKFKELLETFNENPRDVDLYHWDYDKTTSTMVELSMKDFTERGLEEFRTVLDTEVIKSESNGKNWSSVWVKEVKWSDIEHLARSHAGHCSVDNYKKWFTMDNED